MSLVKLRLLTGGESHGPAQSGILEGMPAGVTVSRDRLQQEMRRRMLGYGRGARMKIETDELEVTSGIRHGKTLGSPIAFTIRNLDYSNWREVMDPWEIPAESKRAVSRPRPGHADLAGGLKYSEHDLRNILERASARETVARTAAGALCRELLRPLLIQVCSHVVAIGHVTAPEWSPSWEAISQIQNSERLRCVDPAAEDEMVREIDRAKERKETLGGIIQVAARNVPPGLGSHVHWDRKLDGRIAQAMMSIPSAKGVAIGDAFRIAHAWGSEAHDEIFHEPGRGFYRNTNRAGGTEGGISNGQELRILVAMKPLSTLMKPLQTVDVLSKQAEAAAVERSDVCAVPAGGVAAEAMLCLALADALLEKFGGDTMDELQQAVTAHTNRISDY
jgi:chorismate synthase